MGRDVPGQPRERGHPSRGRHPPRQPLAPRRARELCASGRSDHHLPRRPVSPPGCETGLEARPRRRRPHDPWDHLCAAPERPAVPRPRGHLLRSPRRRTGQSKAHPTSGAARLQGHARPARCAHRPCHGRVMEPPQGFEPWTCGLRNHCSTTELRRRGVEDFRGRTCCLRNSCSTAELCRLVSRAWRERRTPSPPVSRDGSVGVVARLTALAWKVADEGHRSRAV